MSKANLFDMIEPLVPERRAELLKFCNNIGLSESSSEGVEQAARLLREFELYEKPKIPTTKERIDNLVEIAKYSRELQRLLAMTTAIENVYLHGIMEKNLPSDNLPWPEVVPLSGLPKYLEFALNRLELAASSGVDFFSEKFNKNGRKSTLSHYYLYINWIWSSVEGDGITLGRNGKFEKICNAVFEAAGVPAGAEGAVRFFIKNKSALDREILSGWDVE